MDSFIIDKGLLTLSNRYCDLTVKVASIVGIQRSTSMNTIRQETEVEYWLTLYLGGQTTGFNCVDKSQMDTYFRAIQTLMTATETVED